MGNLKYQTNNTKWAISNTKLIYYHGLYMNIN